MEQTIERAKLLACMVAAAFFAACGSVSSSPGSPIPVFTPLRVLIPGSKFAYLGKFSESITYASPSPQQPNSTGLYSTSDLEKVSSAAPNAPAPIDVQRDLRYTVKSAPTSGIQPQRRILDSFESSAVAAGSQTISQAALRSTTTGIDQTANRTQGGGPYRYRSKVTTTYLAPQILLVFPLVIGTRTVPQARTVTTVERSANNKGVVYSSRNTMARYSNAGGYFETGSVGPSETTRVKEATDGMGSLANTGTTGLQIAIGLPTRGPSQTFVIPVSRTEEGVKHTYLANDWYPGGGAPLSPLASAKQTVKGQSRIPSSCVVKVPVSDVQEVDTSSITLDVITGAFAVERTREFLSSGTTVCRIMSSIVYAYGLTSGSLFSTTVDSFEEGLTAASVP